MKFAKQVIMTQAVLAGLTQGNQVFFEKTKGKTYYKCTKEETGLLAYSPAPKCRSTPVTVTRASSSSHKNYGVGADNRPVVGSRSGNFQSNWPGTCMHSDNDLGKFYSLHFEKE